MQARKKKQRRQIDHCAKQEFAAEAATTKHSVSRDHKKQIAYEKMDSASKG